MAKRKVLVVGSNATRIEIQGGGHGPTGQYLNETVVPIMAVIAAGYQIILATPDGTLPTPKDYRAALIAGDHAKAAGFGKGWIYDGYRMTVFSASEETPIEEHILHGKLYFTMPDALGGAGASVTKGDVDFAPYVVEDRELITGQNPKSDHPLAASFVAALGRVNVVPPAPAPQLPANH